MRKRKMHQMSPVALKIWMLLFVVSVLTLLAAVPEFPAGLVVGVVVGLLVLLVICITGLFIWRRNNNGFLPANSEDLRQL